jgi:hypothetical protein
MTLKAFEMTLLVFFQLLKRLSTFTRRLKQRLASESAKNSEQSFVNEDAVDNTLNKGESVHELVSTPSQQRALMDVERQRSTRAFTDHMWQTLE